MATMKQRRAVSKLVETSGNVSKAMREAGYSEATVNNPSVLTKSNGYKALLAEYGLTEELVVRSLVEDIRNKQGKRVTELTLGADILGMRKKENEERIERVSTYNMFFNPQVQSEIHEMEQKIKTLLLQKRS